MASFLKNMFKKSNIDIPQDIVPVQVGDDLELNLSGKRLKGTRGIERFRDITKLQLNNNSDLTSLSDSIGELTNLRELNLSLTKLVTFPENFSRLTNLRKLDLGNVDTIRSLPDFRHLTNLTELTMTGNKLLFHLPESIGNLTNLTNLNLADNRLIDLPESIGNLTNLTYLDLHNNALTSLPESIGNLRNLGMLKLYRNTLFSLPNSIRNLTQPIEILVDNSVVNNIPNNLPANMRIFAIQPDLTRRELVLHRAPVAPVAPVVPVAPVTVVVDRNQVHKEAGKIDYDSLIEVLKNKTTGQDIDTTQINYPDFIKKTIWKFILDSDKTNKSQKEQNKRGLESIMKNRLYGLKFADLSKQQKEYIYYVLEYVKLQSQAFKDVYVTTFVYDCTHAYPGKGKAAMTCAMGALERLLFSLQAAFLSTSEDDKKEEYTEILNIITNTKSKKDLALEHIQKWYAIHKIGTQGVFPEGTSTDDKRASLKAYLKEQFPSPEDEIFVDEQVQMAEYGLTFDDDAFTYNERGGRKRRTRKIRKGKETKKQNKKYGKSKKQQNKKSGKPKKQTKKSRK
jgi:hypothetical protein